MSEKTINLTKLINVLIEKYGYVLNEKSEGGYILIGHLFPDLGIHTIIFQCDDDTKEIKEFIGQLPGEENQKLKRSKILELIDKAILQTKNNDIN
ncbi:hypothetical protein [Pedobacter sp.]|uniref:hypothetical protein n=1 Tax=Pedobacter sp. TaxID=1411316 RepID=UPI003D7FEAE0